MFDKILVAVGGDDASFEPVRVAGRLACALSVGLTVLSVKRPTAEALGEPYYTDLQAERLGETQAMLAQALRVAQAEGARVEIDTLEGTPADQIVGHAAFGGFGLIVMGTRRRGRLQSAILGSVSAKVAAHSKVPVMIVPEPSVSDVFDETQ